MINQFQDEPVGIYDNIEVHHEAPKAGHHCHAYLTEPRIAWLRRLSPSMGFMVRMPGTKSV